VKDEGREVRVLVAEDSPSTREHLSALLTPPRFRLVGLVADGLAAVEEVRRLRPDVVLMDIHMPRMDGLEATRRIMAETPTPVVLMSGAFRGGEAAMSFEGIRAGALSVLAKPAGLGHPAEARSTQEMLTTLRLMAEVRVIHRWPTTSRPRTQGGRRLRMVAIAASTGGPGALAEILGELSPDLGSPILVVQHIAEGFTEGLAEWLRSQTPLTVSVPSAGTLARAGEVYVAPEGFQMGVAANGQIELRAERGDGFCPSGTHLFRSVADSFGRSAMGILLTGMGRDGVEGLEHLRRQGGVTVAQDEATSVVFGMPGAAVQAGAAEHVLPPREIARLVQGMAGRGAA
jgi:two-component system chemotaxis response regulator CheB